MQIDNNICTGCGQQVLVRVHLIKDIKICPACIRGLMAIVEAEAPEYVLPKPSDKCTACADAEGYCPKHMPRPSEDEVELVARAIAKADGVIEKEILLPYWIPHAKAAIAAMQNRPTQGGNDGK